MYTPTTYISYRLPLSVVFKEEDESFVQEEYEVSLGYHELLLVHLKDEELKPKYKLNLQHIKNRLVLLKS
ncbi:hypothetical protein [Bacillus pinisoli]|uniref:hypothetical protein n=1 Tax=Bacillus pinisoli TaxID=2901866 RepID=UPI001FF2490B|nr:hypothetical protein [Bacillus pinisoli]